MGMLAFLLLEERIVESKVGAACTMVMGGVLFSREVISHPIVYPVNNLLLLLIRERLILLVSMREAEEHCRNGLHVFALLSIKMMRVLALAPISQLSVHSLTDSLFLDGLKSSLSFLFLPLFCSTFLSLFVR